MALSKSVRTHHGARRVGYVYPSEKNQTAARAKWRWPLSLDARCQWRMIDDAVRAREDVTSRLAPDILSRLVRS